MSAIKLKKFEYDFNENEPPLKKLVSEGDILIKKLVENQTNTNITLQEHLNTTKQFTKGADVTPLSRFNPGTASLTDILNSTEHFNNIENLKAAGLSEQDAQLYLDSLKGRDHLHTNHKNWERSLLEQHLQEIQKVIESYNQSKPSCNEQKQTLIEYGLSIKPNSVATKLLKFALENTREIKSSLLDPINNIKEIENQCFGHLNEPSLPSLSKIRKKSRKLQRRLNRSTPCVQSSSENVSQSAVKNKSKWDIKEPSEDIITIEKKTYSCLPRTYYTLRNGEIVKLTNTDAFNTDIKIKQKLSLSEIKELPKFKDYSPGQPSKVLFIKNLSSGVKEEDLRPIFKQFIANIIDCKIMKGKLRGRAFITFQDERIASQALNDINGTFLKNKPVIIQYGHPKQ